MIITDGKSDFVKYFCGPECADCLEIFVASNAIRRILNCFMSGSAYQNIRSKIFVSF